MQWLDHIAANTMGLIDCCMFSCPVKVFFFGESRGLKKSFMNECPEKRRVDVALEMFSSSTDSLISNFIEQETEQGKQLLCCRSLITCY